MKLKIPMIMPSISFHSEPDKSKVQCRGQCSLIEKKNGGENRESRAAYPMGLLRFEQGFC